LSHSIQAEQKAGSPRSYVSKGFRAVGPSTG